MYEQIKVSKCKRCGKEFVKAPQTVYKDFCSWSCLCADEKENEILRKKRGEMTKKRAKERQKAIAQGSLKPRTGRACKPVLQYSTDGELVARYNSLYDAAKKIGSSTTCISMCCRGQQHTAKGFIWKYAEKEKKDAKKSK